ncbi:MAG: three-Cys-motif partner protein TcmP [Dehalococcoidia bacterium]|nr:three-Cys-motif partner protein TcmP [Dehalococcoidia bacterium]
MTKLQIPSPVRKWTALKLEYLDYYLQAYVIATKQSREKHYIDAFAGCGDCSIIETGYQIEGSPWRALSTIPSFTQYYFVEKEEDLASHLRVKIFEKDLTHAHVYTGDCNEVIPRLILPKIPKNVPSFTFLDPPGVQINWQTVRSLASHRTNMKMELLILYPYDMAIARLFPIALKNPAVYNTLTRFYGNEKWIEELEDSLEAEETAKQRRERFIQLYLNNLKDLGYCHVEPYGPLYSGHRPLYYVIFASDHAIGAKIMRDVWGKTRFIPGELGYKPVRRPQV